MPENNIPVSGLSAEEVLASRAKHGSNRAVYKRESGLLQALKSLLKEPMVLLLLAASLLYFFSGDIGDGLFMVSAVVLVSAISLFQDHRSRNALQKLKDFTQPECTVIRDGKIGKIKSDELVVGDCLVVEEGILVAADGVIFQSNDFSVNESILTGESLPAFKNQNSEDLNVYQGTTVTTGLAMLTVTAIGVNTKLGKIGKSLEGINVETTPLEKQINHFVKMMVLAGALVFILVWGINFLQSRQLLDSLLKAVTLAMSILPEEIPVAFATFMALGAWRLMKMGIVVKQMKTVETLGSATVICTDKTGTITENKMTLAKLYVLSENTISDPEQVSTPEEKELIRIAMWASEPIPFDPMEQALHEAYGKAYKEDERLSYKMAHEYPLSGKPPMMTHMFANASGNRIIAAKGAPEALMQVSELSTQEIQQIELAMKELAAQGYRILGVGESVYQGDEFPKQQQELKFKFKGIVAFYDPPKKNIQSVLESFYAAGISVKIITGDNALTTESIARQIGFRGYDTSLSGEQLMKLSDEELIDEVKKTQVFTRMFPEAKLRIINALKAGKEIVAMTGDGVNDAPALKAAHIGIAMGRKGTEIARQAASLILLEDDLSSMVDAVAMGRKIYANLKKAIQYIISIHIPIILTVLIPLVLGWVYPNIFSPVHIIFLELIMGPTCSIIYENEPMEANTMLQKPRPLGHTFFKLHELITSILQGLGITAGSLLAYQYMVAEGHSLSATRTAVFCVLISANIFLTLVNRSFYYSLFTTLKYKNNLLLVMIMATLLLTAALLYIPALARFFGFEDLHLADLGMSVAVGLISVIWYEGVKWWKRRKGNTIN